MKLSKQNKWLIVIFIAAAIIIPIIIHFIFVPNGHSAPIISRWSSGELLGYCGAVLGSIATIIAIIMTINFTLDNQREERKLGIKPYLHSSYRPIYSLPLSDSVVYVSVNEQLSSSAKPPFLFQKAFEKKESQAEQMTAKSTFLRSYHVINYELTNVGAGNAVNINFTINGRPFMPPFTLQINATKSFVLVLSEKLLIDNRYQLYFEITFSDVASLANYKQCETIKFYRDDNDNTLSTAQNIEWLISTPSEVV